MMRVSFVKLCVTAVPLALVLALAWWSGIDLPKVAPLLLQHVPPVPRSLLVMVIGIVRES